MTFQNEAYKEGWLETTVRLVKSDLVYISTCTDERMKREKMAQTLNMVNDAIDRCDTANAERAHDNERKRHDALNRRTNAEKLLPPKPSPTEEPLPIFLNPR